MRLLHVDGLCLSQSAIEYARLLKSDWRSNSTKMGRSAHISCNQRLWRTSTHPMEKIKQSKIVWGHLCADMSCMAGFSARPPHGIWASGEVPNSTTASEKYFQPQNNFTSHCSLQFYCLHAYIMSFRAIQQCLKTPCGMFDVSANASSEPNPTHLLPCDEDRHI